MRSYRRFGANGEHGGADVDGGMPIEVIGGHLLERCRSAHPRIEHKRVDATVRLLDLSDHALQILRRSRIGCYPLGSPTYLDNRGVDLIGRATRDGYRRALSRQSLRDRQTDAFGAVLIKATLPANRSI